jgi:pimeloyl-ACP methyl ester carboxylesterase
MLTWRSLGLLGVSSLCLLGLACASPAQDAGVVEANAAALVKLACEDSVDSVYRQPGDLEPLNENRLGDIVRCAPGERLNVEALQRSLSEGGFRNVAVQNEVQVYRISYRTQRAVRGADVSSALVVVPVQDTNQGPGNDDRDRGDYDQGDNRRRTPVYDDEDKGQRGPLVVYGHGTVPYRQDCAYSRANPATAAFLDAPDLELRMVLALAAQGFPVIMPDYAGFVAGSPLAGYMFAEDEAYSVLDATRAMKKLLEQFPDRVTFVGHSQGGHAVLAAQSYARSYGMAGNLAGVVALAPFWAPARTFGIIASPESGYTSSTPEGAYALNAAIEYFYTHAELLDGPGQGAELLRFNIGDLIGQPGTECLVLPDVSRFGETGAELFTSAIAPVASCALAGEGCEDPQAQQWSERFVRDRPTLDARGAPVLLWQGKQDLTVPVNLAGCGIEKLSADFAVSDASATFKACADADADHETLESRNAEYVIQWIEARAQGGPEPSAACGDPALLEASCFIGNFD